MGRHGRFENLRIGPWLSNQIEGPWYLLTNLRRTGGHESWLVEVEAIVVGNVGVAVVRPVWQEVVDAVLFPAAVVGLMCQETLADLLLQFTQVTPTTIVLDSPHAVKSH